MLPKSQPLQRWLKKIERDSFGQLFYLFFQAIFT